MISKLKKYDGFTHTPKFLVSGFTILETIVAIAVLSLSISGAFSAVQQSLSRATISKDEVKAFYLAQEAIEIIRNKRDSNQIANINSGPVNWLSGITNICPFSDNTTKYTCKVEAYNFSISSCGTGDWGICPVLMQDSGGSTPSYLFSYSTGLNTNFKREIQIESISANEIAVTVQVSWTKGVLPFKFKIKELLFNWM